MSESARQSESDSAWEIAVSEPSFFTRDRAFFPTRVLCGDAVVGELLLTQAQLDRFAAALGLVRNPPPGGHWVEIAPSYRQAFTLPPEAVSSTRIFDLGGPEGPVQS